MKTLNWTSCFAFITFLAIALSCQSPKNINNVDTYIDSTSTPQIEDSIPTTKDTVASPIFSPTPGHYTLDSGELKTISISTTTANAQLYYSLYNNLELDSFQKVPASGYISIAKSSTLSAYATKDNFIGSPITTGIYTIAFTQSQPLQNYIAISGMISVSKSEYWADLKVGLFQRKGLDAWPGGSDSAAGYMWLNDLNDSLIKPIQPIELAQIDGSVTQLARSWTLNLPPPDSIGNKYYCLIAWIDANQDSAWNGIDKGFQYTGANRLSEYNVLAKHTISQKVSASETIAYPDARIKFLRKTNTIKASWGIDAYDYAQGQNKNWTAKDIKEDGTTGFHFFVNPVAN